MLLLLGAIRLLKHPDRRAPIWIIAVSGLCLTLSKASGFLLVLVTYPILAGLLAVSRRFGPALRLLPGLVTCFALYLWLPKWIGQYCLYGGTPGRLTLSQYLGVIFGWLGWNMARNSLGQFAWFEINFPTLSYVLFIALLVVFLIGSLAYLARAVAKRDDDPDLKPSLLLFLTFVALVVGTFVYQYVVAPKYGLVIQGRHILFALPMVYLCLGMLLSLSTSRARHLLVVACAYLVATGFLLFLFFSSIGGLWLIIERFFWNPGITLRAMTYWMMQYKPEFMKNDVSFAALSAAYVLVHLGILIYFTWLSRDWVGQLSKGSRVA